MGCCKDSWKREISDTALSYILSNTDVMCDPSCFVSLNI